MVTEASRSFDQLRHGDHLCLLYEDPAEYAAALASSHLHGLAAGNRCVHIADAPLTDRVRWALAEMGVDVDREVERGALAFLAPEDLYLKQPTFEPAAIFAFWHQAQEEALDAGFAGLHVTGDVTWLMNGTPGLERFGEYEREVNKAILHSRMQAVCCYNRRLLPPAVLANMLRSHPSVVFGQEVLRPDLLVHGQDSALAEDWLETFLRRLRQSEDALCDTLHLKAKLFELVPAAIYVCDADGLITSYNQKAAELWGRAPRLGDPDDRFCGSFRLHWPDGCPLPHSETPMAIAVREGRPFTDAEVVIERPDGSRATVLVNIAPLHDPQGRVNGAVNCFLDITGRKRAEEAQRTLNARLAAELEDACRLQETSTQLIQTGDSDALNRQILDAAKAIMRSDMASMQMFYPERGELHLLMHQGFDPAAAQFWEWVPMGSGSSCGQAFRTGQRVIVPDIETCDFMAGTDDLVMSRQTGIRAVQTTPLLSRSGSLLGVISTHWNQPHTPSERELRLLDVLARQAADLIERNMAEEALRDADRRKDEFLAMLSHELRNPLAPIRNAVDLLRLDENEPAVREEALAAVEHQVDQLTHLVNDLLDVSRVTTGRVQLQRADLDLNALVQRTSDAFRPLMAERQHQFTVSLSGTPLWVNGDATRLEQVLVNLLSNAAKYTPDGGQVSLSIRRDGDYAVLSVQDNGMGIEADLLPRVFDLFVQGKQALDRAQGGLGLGLSLVKSLVEMHGGKVTAISEGAGQGSELTVRLPLLPSPPDEQRPGSTPNERSTAGGLKLLVVDDNFTAAKLAARLLARKGHTVETAHDGPSAVQAALEQRPDVMLLDIGLPGMNGYEVAQRLRQEEDLRGMVIVAVTGYGQAEDVRRSREAGFDHHLVKPADMNALERILTAAAGAKAP